MKTLIHKMYSNSISLLSFKNNEITAVFFDEKQEKDDIFLTFTKIENKKLQVFLITEIVSIKGFKACFKVVKLGPESIPEGLNYEIREAY